MDERYSIENLIKTFERHSEFCKKQRDEWTPEQRKNMNENKHLHDIDFDISLALKSMCGEILDMNDRINEIVDHLNGDRG